jgi:hypothetical protein
MPLRLLLMSFTFLCLLSQSFSQQKLFDAVKTSMCDCLTQKRSQSSVEYPDIKECMKNAMLNNIELINEEIKRRYPDSSDYNKGYIVGQELGRNLDTSMVYTCDTYFMITDSLRFAIFNQYNKDSALTRLRSLKASSISQSSEFFIERAKLNFLTANFKQSLDDIEEGAKSQKNKNVLLILKGLALDRIGKYEEAATVFYLLASLSGENSYFVSAAIENRKALAHK